MKRATTSLPVPDSPVRAPWSRCARRGGVREHVLPLLRLADDAPLARARFELAGERRDLRFEPGRDSRDSAWLRAASASPLVRGARAR